MLEYHGRAPIKSEKYSFIDIFEHYYSFFNRFYSFSPSFFASMICCFNMYIYISLYGKFQSSLKQTASSMSVLYMYKTDIEEAVYFKVDWNFPYRLRYKPDQYLPIGSSISPLNIYLQTRPITRPIFNSMLMLKPDQYFPIVTSTNPTNIFLSAQL